MLSLFWVLVSVDWWDINQWGEEVYMYTSPVGDGWQSVTNGVPGQCIINPYPYYYGARPLKMEFLLHFEPFYQAFHWRDDVTRGICGWYYPAVCPGFMYGSLVNLISGQVQPVQGITLTIFKDYLW